MKRPVVLVAFLFGIFTICEGWGSSDKVLLSDVKAVTLQQGRMTNGRRSAPVPQLSCVGGAARHKFQPQTVQCINMGSDGHDMQWECKADMDNSYKFGQVQVSCEGYDYPDDPFVLKGSCGLEYTIEFTEEGLHRERASGSSYNYNTYQSGNTSKGESDWGAVKFIVIVVIMFLIYNTCIKRAPATPNQGPQPTQGPNQPPPYGFRPEFSEPNGPPPSYEQSTGPSSAAYDRSYTQGNPAYDRASAPPPDADCGSNTRQARDNSGPGFWSGAATGAGLGYLFGNRNRGGNHGGWGSGWGSSSHTTHHHHHHHSNPSATNHSSGWFSSGSNSGNNGGGGGSSSSGSRTASGFGGTSRR